MTWRLKSLVSSLQTLASPASAQPQHLENLGTPGLADDLALEFDGTAAAAETMLEESEINIAQHDSILELNNYLKRMSNKECQHLWKVEALSSAEEWRHVRAMAAKCLTLLT